MKKSLIISTTGHIGLLALMAFAASVPNHEYIDPPSVLELDLIPLSQFDAMISEAPTNIAKKLLNKPSNKNLENEPIKIELDTEVPDLTNKLDKITLQNEDQNYVVNNEAVNLNIDKRQAIKLKNPKKIMTQEMIMIEPRLGNEFNSYASPKIAKPKARTADRIDKVAVSKSSSENIVEKPQKAIEASDEALKVIEITKAEAPKEASTKISPEGKKNVEIVASGAVQSSAPPPSRPKTAEKLEKPPVKRPTASELLKKTKEIDQIERLLSQIEMESGKKTPEVSIVEKNNMMAAISQKLAKYWEQGILAGNSNFEKYVVQVEVEVNSIGKIVGGVKPLIPAVPKGRYLIAFRQASNAIISAGILPIVPDKYPSGITFKITFDPESGFSF
jgi:hypothetical protein